MAEPTIAAGSARALLDLAVAKGAGRKTLLERSRIDPADLQDPDNRLPLARYVALMRAGQELCRDPALALHFGEAVDLAEMSIVGLMGRGFETFADALMQVNRYAPLIVEAESPGNDRFVLQREAGKLWLVDARPNPNDFPELTESTFARIVCTARRHFGEVRFVQAIEVTHPAPAYREEYGRVFGLPVTFESRWNALLLDGAFLTHRLAEGSTHASRYVEGLVSAQAEELLRRLEQSKTTRGRVERLLLPLLHTGRAEMATIADQLGLSRQTLFRKLKQEGVTFEKVLDELRHAMALHHLQSRGASVKETAYLVGFSEPAAFSRAFKRWTGSSPGAVARSKPGEGDTGREG